MAATIITLHVQVNVIDGVNSAQVVVVAAAVAVVCSANANIYFFWNEFKFFSRQLKRGSDKDVWLMCVILVTIRNYMVKPPRISLDSTAISSKNATNHFSWFFTFADIALLSSEEIDNVILKIIDFLHLRNKRNQAK